MLVPLDIARPSVFDRFDILCMPGVNTDEVDGHTEDWDDICVEILVDEVETVVD